MKKIMVAVAFAVLMVAGSPVFAQEKENGSDSDYYYVNITLERIYPYPTGYVVQYRKGLNQIDRLYLPMEWFVSTAGKGEIITLPAGTAWPSLTAFYKDGTFSHLRLYVHRSPSHQTWGTIPQNINLDSQFENVEDIKIKF